VVITGSLEATPEAPDTVVLLIAELYWNLTRANFGAGR